MIKTAIVNVVMTASLNQTLDFDEIRKFREIFHDTEVYGGRVAYFKTSNMGGRVSLFPSGKMISVGTRSEKRAFSELNQAMRFLVQIGSIKKVKLNPKTQNIVATADLEACISLEELFRRTRGIYEPEQFPGLILRIEDPYKATILVFASGKIVIAGLKNSEQIIPTAKRLEKIIKNSVDDKT